jgi:hypothetical protein
LNSKIKSTIGIKHKLDKKALGDVFKKSYINEDLNHSFEFIKQRLIKRLHDELDANNKKYNLIAYIIFQYEMKGKDGNFLNRLEDAISNPEGRDSKFLFHQLETILKVVSGNVEFSPAARASLLQVMYSQMYLYNLPSWFNTYSPDDNYDILTIRRALVDKRVSKDENGFKDSEVDEIYECLQKGGEGRIHCSELVTSNGVAAAMTFERRKQARAKHLLGVDLGARKTTVVEDKLKGIFGVVYNIQSVLETKLGNHETYVTENLPDLECFNTAFSDINKRLLDLEMLHDRVTALETNANIKPASTKKKSTLKLNELTDATPAPNFASGPGISFS